MTNCSRTPPTAATPTTDGDDHQLSTSSTLLLSCLSPRIDHLIVDGKQMSSSASRPPSEKAPPERTYKHRIAITDYGRGDPLQSNNLCKERTSHRRRYIRMVQQNEMSRLREPIHHCQDHRLAVHLGKSLNEVNGHIRPDRCRNPQRLKKTSRVKMLTVVALAHRARPNKVLNRTRSLGR